MSKVMAMLFYIILSCFVVPPVTSRVTRNVTRICCELLQHRSNSVTNFVVQSFTTTSFVFIGNSSKIIRLQFQIWCYNPSVPTSLVLIGSTFNTWIQFNIWWYNPSVQHQLRLLRVPLTSLEFSSKFRDLDLQRNVNCIRRELLQHHLTATILQCNVTCVYWEYLQHHLN